MKRIAAWIVALAMPVVGLAAESAADKAPAETQATNDTVQTPKTGAAGPGTRSQAPAGGNVGKPGCFGGRRWGKRGPPYGAGYEARRQWQGGGPAVGRAVGRNEGRNGRRGAGCGR